MDIFEQKQVLSTFSILVDNREQNTRRAKSRYESFGCPYSRATLNYGDYAGNVILPDGSPLLDLNQTLSPRFVIERKMNLDELAMCFTRSRDRFRREFERASENGAKVILICEDATWEKLQNHNYRSQYNPAAFKASLVAWSVRYGFAVEFCRAETSGSLIREYLYRDIKERLERGEFD